MYYTMVGWFGDKPFGTTPSYLKFNKVGSLKTIRRVMDKAIESIDNNDVVSFQILKSPGRERME